MNTTSIVAEQIICGILAATWIVLAIFAPATFAQITVDPDLPWIPLTIFLAAALYLLGAMSDRFADVFMTMIRPMVDRIPCAKSLGQLSDSDRNRLSIYLKESEAHTFIEYLRRMIRVLRAIAFNSLPIFVVTLARFEFYWVQPVVFFLVFLVAVLCWAALVHEYEQSLVYLKRKAKDD